MITTWQTLILLPLHQHFPLEIVPWEKELLTLPPARVDVHAMVKAGLCCSMNPTKASLVFKSGRILLFIKMGEFSFQLSIDSTDKCKIFTWFGNHNYPLNVFHFG
jgi:hypothetical protein